MAREKERDEIERAHVCVPEREREYLVTSGLRSRMLKMGSVYNEFRMSMEKLATGYRLKSQSCKEFIAFA